MSQHEANEVSAVVAAGEGCFRCGGGPALLRSSHTSVQEAALSVSQELMMAKKVGDRRREASPAGRSGL